MFNVRHLTRILTPCLLAGTAVAQCDWEAVPSPNPSPVLNGFIDAETSPAAFYTLLYADDSLDVGNPIDPHVLRRDAGAWVDLGSPDVAALDAAPDFFTLHVDAQERVWLGGVVGDSVAVQDPPVIAMYDDGWSAPVVVEQVNQLIYPFRERGGAVYAIDTAPDGTRFAVGIAKGYGVTDDGSVPLFLIDDGTGWTEATDPHTDWPGGFAADTYLTDVVAFAANDVWAIGRHAAEDGGHARGGLIVHWNGSALTMIQAPQVSADFVGHPLERLAVAAPNDIWAVGGSFHNPQTSTIAHYDGEAWTRIESPIAFPLRSVTLGADGTAWAAPVNYGGDVATYDGTTWSAAPSPQSDANIVAMTRDGDGTAWMFGATSSYDSLALRLTECTDCDADLNGDQSVGFDDLTNVLGAWGACNGACPADMDDNGIVDLSDLLYVLSAWGSC